MYINIRRLYGVLCFNKSTRRKQLILEPLYLTSYGINLYFTYGSFALKKSMITWMCRNIYVLFNIKALYHVQRIGLHKTQKRKRIYQYIEV